MAASHKTFKRMLAKVTKTKTNLLKATLPGPDLPRLVLHLGVSHPGHLVVVRTKDDTSHQIVVLRGIRTFRKEVQELTPVFKTSSWDGLCDWLTRTRGKV